MIIATQETLTWAYRPLETEDQPFLWEMLYEAIYIAPRQPAPPRHIIYEPMLAQYAENWGQTGDDGLLAYETVTKRPLGAAWLRYSTAEKHGYGFISPEIPELSIALLPNYRGQGIGSALLKSLLASGKWAAISLSVSPENPAFGLYTRCGFVTVGREGDSLTMLWQASHCASPEIG